MLRYILPTVLDTKCNNIFQEERSFAKAVAEEVIGPQTAGVWDFIMPPVFLVNLFKHRRKKEAFILNFLFTKRLALQGARDMVDRNLTREEALKYADEVTANVLSGQGGGVYSEKVRQKQLREIELLVDHYYRLIMSTGKTYKDMLKGAYQSKAVYGEFLQRLNRAEREVNHAALQTVGRNESSVNFVNRMEKAVEAFRQSDMEKYYPEAEGEE